MTGVQTCALPIYLEETNVRKYFEVVVYLRFVLIKSKNNAEFYKEIGNASRCVGDLSCAGYDLFLSSSVRRESGPSGRFSEI